MAGEAKQRKVRRRIREVPIETQITAIEWMRGDISTRDVQMRTGDSSVNGVIYRMGGSLRAAFHEGLIATTRKFRELEKSPQA